MIAFLSSLATLILLLFKEFFSAQAIAKKADSDFKLSQDVFDQIVSRSLTKMRDDARSDSSEASVVEDKLDADLKKRNAEPLASEKVKQSDAGLG